MNARGKILQTSTVITSHTVDDSEFTFASVTSKASRNHSPDFFTYEPFNVMYAEKTMPVPKGEMINFEQLTNDLDRKFKLTQMEGIAGKLNLAIFGSNVPLNEDTFKKSQIDGVDSYTFTIVNLNDAEITNAKHSVSPSVPSNTNHPAGTGIYAYRAFSIS